MRDFGARWFFGMLPVCMASYRGNNGLRVFLIANGMAMRVLGSLLNLNCA